MAAEASTPVTARPRAASGSARRPVPTPSSSTLPPGGTSAASRCAQASTSVTSWYQSS